MSKEIYKLAHHLYRFASARLEKHRENPWPKRRYFDELPEVHQAAWIDLAKHIRPAMLQQWIGPAMRNHFDGLPFQKR